MAQSTSTDTDFSKIALVLAAHGSPSPTHHGSPTQSLADHISKMNIFSSVSCGFLEQDPKIDGVIKNLVEPDVYVVPVMACKGYIANTKLPRALSLTGDVTERIGPKGRQRITITEPLGVDENIQTLATKLLNEAMERMNVAPHTAGAIIVGHGSMQSRASFEQTTLIADGMNKAQNDFSVKCAFLEEPPRIGGWKEISPAKNLFILPIMISDGHHGRRDIPNEIGIEPDIKFADALSSGVAGPYEIDGINIYMLAPLGEAVEMSDIVISTVKKEIKKGR